MLYLIDPSEQKRGTIKNPFIAEIIETVLIILCILAVSCCYFFEILHAYEIERSIRIFMNVMFWTFFILIFVSVATAIHLQAVYGIESCWCIFAPSLAYIGVLCCWMIIIQW